MKENNNILIITRSLYYQYNIFRDIASLTKDCVCTYYDDLNDIKSKNKHIKITQKRADIQKIIGSSTDKPDIIILDIFLDTDEFNPLLEYCRSVTSNVIYIDFEDAVYSYFVREIKDNSVDISD